MKTRPRLCVQYVVKIGIAFYAHKQDESIEYSVSKSISVGMKGNVNVVGGG